MKARILRYWTYFRRGHSTYLAFLMSFANFMVIQYRLLIQYVPFLEVLFSSLAIFIASFVLVYLPLATLIGRFDYEKFAYQIDSIIVYRQNPFFQDIAKCLVMMCDGRNEEARQIMEKWIVRDV